MTDLLLKLIVLLPLAGAALIGFAGLSSASFRKKEGLIGVIGTAAVALPFLFALFAYPALAISNDQALHFSILSWMKAGSLDVSFSYTIDHLSFLMALIVNGVGALIHVYSIGYMKGEKGFYKFFAYLNLFIFAMNNLILADNMLVMFLGWEGVGLCSYLLIGFWYQDMIKAEAAQKAFVVNRIGDFAMLIGMFLAFQAVGSLNFEIINQNLGLPGEKTFWLALLVFIAATGKSAQIPLFVWLPDAMAGPTPVSALIHAATMVTSGVYVIARMHPVFTASPEVMALIAIVAAATAILAALTALAQNDIKKVLAYSTVSQLGFMFMALGAGAYTAAIFHVMTHAFFKACLFLGSGSVIHAMEHTHAVKDPQDIRSMGGLGKFMPATSRTFWISTLAISGIPLFSGFFSKDEILSSTFFAGHQSSIYYLVWGVGVITAFLTAFYMTRLAQLTFGGEPRFDAVKHPPHESPSVMTLPLWVLAALAIVGGFAGLPAILGHFLHIEDIHLLNAWLRPDVAASHIPEGPGVATTEMLLILLSIAVAVAGVWVSRGYYQKGGVNADERLAQRLGAFYESMRGKFYFDELYELIVVKPFEWLSRVFVKRAEEGYIDAAVEGTAGSVSAAGEVLRRLQSGLVQNYAVIVTMGALVLLSYLLFG